MLPPRSPESPEGWMVVCAAWLICLLLAGFNLSFTIIYQELIQRYHGSATETAWVLATYSAIKMFSSPLVSVLSNRYSYRGVAMVGSLLHAAALVVSAYAPNLKVLYFTFGIVGGFGSNMVYHPPFPAISYYFDRRRGLAMALASTGCGVGGMIMAPVMELLFREYGYSGAMLIIAGIMLNCCVGSMLLFPVNAGDRDYGTGTRLVAGGKASNLESLGSFGSFMVLNKKPLTEDKTDCLSHEHEINVKSPNGSLPQQENGTAGSHSSKIHEPTDQRNWSGDGVEDTYPETTSGPEAVCLPRNRSVQHAVRSISSEFDLHLFKSTYFLLYCIMMTGYYMCFATTNTFLSGIALSIGFHESQVALMLTISYALDTPSRLVSGFLLDVLYLQAYHTPLLVCLSIMAALTAILLPLPTTPPGLFTLWVVYQFLFNGTQVHQVPLIVEIVGVDNAMGAVGLARVFMGIGEIAGPLVGGIIRDKTGSYEFAFYFAGCTFIAACLVLQAHDIVTRQNSCKINRQQQELATQMHASPT